MPDWRRLKHVRNPYILPLTASMFDWKFTINNLDSDGRDHIQFTNDAEKDIYIVYDLGDSQGMLKVLVSALKSEGWNFAKFGKVKKNTLYVYFITRRGVARLNVDTVYIVNQRLLHFCFNFCFFFVFKPIFTEHP